MDRCHQQIAAKQILVFQGVSVRIVFVMQEQRAHHRQAAFRILRNGGFDVGLQGSEDGRHTRKVGDGFAVAIKLPVIARAVALVGTHHRCEGAEVAPAQQQLFAAFHLKQRGITADVAVMQPVPGHCQ